VKSGQVRSCQARLGKVRLGQVRSCQGQFRSFQVPVKLKSDHVIQVRSWLV